MIKRLNPLGIGEGFEPQCICTSVYLRVCLNPLGIGEGFEPLSLKQLQPLSLRLNPLGIGEGFELRYKFPELNNITVLIP